MLMILAHCSVCVWGGCQCLACNAATGGAPALLMRLVRTVMLTLCPPVQAREAIDEALKPARGGKCFIKG